jgi:chromosome segregation protein
VSGIEESILFTKQQLTEEDDVLQGLVKQLEELRKQVDAKRVVVDEKRTVG